MRSVASRADQDLIKALAARHVVVSGTQLERWRHAGLLPRAERRWDGKYGSHAVHQDGLMDHVEDVARHVRRGRPLEVTAVAVFAEGKRSVPDALLMAGVQRIADDFASDWATQRQRARLTLEQTQSGEPVDELAIAEYLSAEIAGSGGQMVRSWRQNLRRHPTSEMTPANREVVVTGAVTSVMRLLAGDQPESDDSLVELAAASGAAGAFEKAPFADAPMVSEGVSALRNVFQDLDISQLPQVVRTVTAEELRHGAVVFRALCQIFTAVPDEARYYLGVTVFPTFVPEDPASSVLFLLAFLLLSRGGLDVAPWAAVAVQWEIFDESAAAQVVQSAAWLNSRPFFTAETEKTGEGDRTH